MPTKPWDIVNSGEESAYGIFSLRRDRARSPRTNKEHDFIVLQSPDWVNVIPLTPDKEVVMISQWRHGIRRPTLELPGGVVDEGETIMKAAKRELLEETGYVADELISLGSVHTNPAFFNNLCHTFLAKNVCRRQKQDLDDKEDIEVVLVPVSEIPEMLRAGVITHSLIAVAFYRYFMEYTHHLPE
ncbi:MAG: NUDIX hydrolase [Syntrophales bacterium]|nr:NUDIX hydrolase [Syntrophales bacterium]